MVKRSDLGRIPESALEETPEFALESFEFYGGQGERAAYEWLVREAPVYYYEPLDTWVLSRYDDVRLAARSPEYFSNKGAHSLNMIRLLHSGAGRALDHYFEDEGEMVMTLDPPRNRQIKTTLTPGFNPRAVRNIEADIRRFANDLLDKITPDEPIDFLQEIASPFPILVAERVLGLRPLDLSEVMRWVNALEMLTQVESADELFACANDFASMAPFLGAEVERKRSEGGEDLFTLLLNTELDGAPLPTAVALSHVATFISNGGTTRALMGNMISTLAAHPDQRTWIADDPALIPGAIEEVLRFEPSARGFARQVVKDIELHGRSITAGQHLYLLYAAANRDPRAFKDPHRFDIKRNKESLHLSFGFGTHACLGQALVRLEIAVFMEELLKRYPTWEVVAEGRTRQDHVQVNAWRNLPVVFRQPGSGASASPG